MEQLYSISPLGNSALVTSFGNVIDEALNQKVLSIAHIVSEAAIPGVVDIVPAYSSITICYDVAGCEKHGNASAFETLKTQLETLLLKPAEDLKHATRYLKIPVCYSSRFALDLQEIAKHTGLSADEIVKLHTAKTYRVYMVGFLPGFAYMGEVDERIAVPRKQQPRLQIEEGYVGIAGKQTGIYPLTSPGGWQIIGRTPLKLFDKTKEEPVLFAAGDKVEFFSITEDEFHNY